VPIFRAMQTVYDTAGGADGLLRLANVWHARVIADEVVSHAFSHGFHPEHIQRPAAYWGDSPGGPRTYADCDGVETSAARLHSGNGLREEMDRRGSSVSIMHWQTSPSPTTEWDGCCTQLCVGDNHDDVPIPPLRR
jgi:hypothetical protein